MIMKAIVIGAGVVGASVARALSRRGVPVTVLDAQAPAARTSGASFAWVNANEKLPRPYHDLNARAVELYHGLHAELGPGFFFPAGNLEWATGVGADRLVEKVSRLHAWGYRAEIIDRNRACRLEPGLILPDGRDAVFAFYPDEGWVDVPALVSRFLAEAAGLGATILFPVRALDLIVASGRVTGVRTGVGDLEADAVVDCSGAQAGRILEPLGVAIKRRFMPGLLATFDSPVAVNRVVRTPEVHLRPDGRGRVVAGGPRDLDAGLQDGRGWELIAALHERACRILPGLTATALRQTVVGVRPMPADGLSAVGPAGPVEGYYLVFTHSGVTLGPLIGELLADELVTGNPSPLLEEFRPDRLLEPGPPFPPPQPL